MMTAWPLAIGAYTATSCVGRGNRALLGALLAQRSGLLPQAFDTFERPAFLGAVDGLDDAQLPASLADFECRNNRLAALTLAQDGFDAAVHAAITRYGADRVGVFVGTSTSGLLQTELAYRRRETPQFALPADFHYAQTHNTYSLAAFVCAATGARGPASVTSVACASSAKVFGSAARAIAAGLVDVAIVGGVDTLCLTTLYGFSSLELLSSTACRPFDRERDGISIGEAGAFLLLLRREDATADAPLCLGIGESSDAHHMSSPHPEGAGAELAMRRALHCARLEPAAIDYLNLHGTATPSNDLAEDRAVHRVFGGSVPVSSTKGAHGHTLGAAGAIEAVVSLLALREGLIPAGVNTREVDPALQSPYLLENRRAPVARVLSNSFGFGGSNCSLVFGETAH